MISSEIEQIYHKWLANEYPSGAESQKVNDGVLTKLGKRIGALANQTDFQIIYLDEFVSSYRYDANTYTKLLATFPKIIGIEDDERQKGFLHEISEVVSKHGEITVPVLSSLIILEKKLDFISEIVGLPKN